MIAVIAGATGLTGSYLLRNLLADQNITKVLSVGRKSSGVIDPKLKEFIIDDLAKLRSLSSELSGDYYFCALGTTIKAAKSKENFSKIDYDAVVEFGEIAKLHSAKSLTVISAMNVKESSPFFYNQVKAKAEKALLSLGLNRLVIMRPGLLVGDRKDFRLGEMIAVKILTLFSDMNSAKKNTKLMTHVDLLAIKMQKLGTKDSLGVFYINSKDI